MEVLDEGDVDHQENGIVESTDRPPAIGLENGRRPEHESGEEKNEPVGREDSERALEQVSPETRDTRLAHHSGSEGAVEKERRKQEEERDAEREMGGEVRAKPSEGGLVPGRSREIDDMEKEDAACGERANPLDTLEPRLRGRVDNERTETPQSPQETKLTHRAGAHKHGKPAATRYGSKIRVMTLAGSNRRPPSLAKPQPGSCATASLRPDASFHGRTGRRAR
jgi:hypothetical protein